MSNHRRVSGYILIAEFIVLSHLFAETGTNSTFAIVQSSTPTSEQMTNVTRTHGNTVNQRNLTRQCVNCTSVEYEDPIGIEQLLQRKRRKRRRNRRPPHRRNEQRGSPAPNKDRPYKKHSTRVRLDRPVQFLIAPDAPTTNKANPLSTSVPTRENNSIAPPPVRYLLPPLVDRSLNRIEIAVRSSAADKKTTKSEPLSSAGRGSTKFKNTIHYKGYYKGNEIDTNDVYFTSTSPANVMEVGGQVAAVRGEFKPIVVQPTPPYTVDNVTWQSQVDETSKFVSNEVANAGMQVISMRTTLISAPTTATSRTKQFREHQFDDSQQELRRQRIPERQTHAHSQQERTIKNQQHDPQGYQAYVERLHDREKMIAQKSQPISQQFQPAQVQKSENYQTQLNRVVEIPPPIQGTDEWQNNILGPGESSQNSQHSSAVISSSWPNDNDVIQNEVFPDGPQKSIHSHENATQLLNDSHHQSLSLQNYHNNNHLSFETRPPISLHDDERYSFSESTTATPLVQRTTTSSPRYQSSTTMRVNRKQSSGKGLDLAETQYFSDLPSEQEVSSLFQNENQVIPGTAGKDYPIFGQSLLQKRKYSCRGLEGYYADISTRCQVFYICNGNGAGEPMLCPNGTLFSQELLVCDWWYNVDC